MRGWRPAPATHVPPDEVDEVRLVTTWVAANRPPTLLLADRGRAAVEAFVARHVRGGAR